MIWLLCIALLAGVSAIIWRIMPKGATRYVTILVLSCSLALYATLGSYRTLDAISETQAKQQKLRHEMQAWAEILRTHPESVKHWALMGQALVEVQQYDKASEAFKQAVLRSEGNPVLMLAYAKSLIFAAGGEVTDKAKEALKMVLMITPNQPDAEFFTGLGEVQQGQFKQAEQRWIKARDAMPKDSPFRQHIQEQLEKLQARMR